jgi:hypothetical protein
MINVTIIRVDSDGDGVTDLEEDGAPHGGDGNRDGTADRLQSYVASLRGSTDSPYATFAAAPQVTLSNVSAAANPAPGTAPADVQFPLGFFRFDASGIAAGGATTVTIYAQAGTALNTFYGYGPTPDNATPHWYPFQFNGATGAAVFADRIELHLADGQRGDGDPAASRIAFGPGGPGLTPTPWTNPQDRFDANNDGATTAADALTLINALNVTGPQTLPLVPAAGEMLPPFRDTNWDNLMEAADVLNIVNFLNGQAAGEGEGAGTDAAKSRLAPSIASGWLSAGDRSPHSAELAIGPSSHDAATPRPYAAVQCLDTTVVPALPVASPGSKSNASGRRSPEEEPRSLDASWQVECALEEIAADVAQRWGWL